MKKKIKNPDVTNESFEYWEKVLASHGLGVNQPLTDNSDDETVVEAPHIPRNSSLSVKQNDLQHLRTIVDKGDRFMEAHEVKKARSFYGNRIIPEWSQNDVRVREIVLRAFPKALTSEAQQRKAGRWVRFIYLYYRLKLSEQIILKEMKMTAPALEALVRTLGRVSKGLTRHGKERKGLVVVQPVREQ